jgi:hypothetical protein
MQAKGHKYFLAGRGLLSEDIFPETSLSCLLSWLIFLTSVFAGKFRVITRSFDVDVFSKTEKNILSPNMYILEFEVILTVHRR